MTVDSFVQQLAKWREKDREARERDPEWGFDWVQRAWDKTVTRRPYHARRNGLGERLPAFCLKIPTGGGKTLLATRVIGLVNAHFRKSRRGLVLWIVPTTQIYNQTLKALKDRDHPTASNSICRPASEPASSRRPRPSARAMSPRTSAFSC
ncbi:DEAD/DEAH box helicase family protein [Candidatus Palauibacter sp.]|uniref:DEAD/DEAH box helicase family protein n=1 Tax=Candidatus Palauibacter sp. TaxID=3101350 RepID=UPI003B020F72